MVPSGGGTHTAVIERLAGEKLRLWYSCRVGDWMQLDHNFQDPMNGVDKDGNEFSVS